MNDKVEGFRGMFATLNDQATAMLRTRILSGALSAGSRILEADLAGELGLSRGTLRSALQQLGHEGLVTQKRFHSTFVTSLSAQDVFEIYTMRNMLEAMAAWHAASRINGDGATALDDIIASMATSAARGDREAVVDADLTFHKCVVRLSAHSKLMEHYRIIGYQARLYLGLTSQIDYDLQMVLRIHSELSVAIQSGNADLAKQLAEDHNTPDGKRIVRLLRDQAEGEGSNT